MVDSVVGADRRATRGGAAGPARASRGALGPRRVEVGRARLKDAGSAVPSSMLCVKLPLFCRPPRRCESASAQVAGLFVERLGPFRRRAVALVTCAALDGVRRRRPQIVLRSAIFLIRKGPGAPRPSLRRARAGEGAGGLGGRP